MDAPRRLGPGDAALPRVLALLRHAFAGMEGRIDPPSSLDRMGVDDLRTAAREAELWVIGDPPRACVILTPRRDALYLGKLAVGAAWRGTGLARRLVAQARNRARDLGLARLELQTRVELTENHAVFARLGFTITGRTRHPGFDRPTSVTMTRPVD